MKVLFQYTTNGSEFTSADWNAIFSERDKRRGSVPEPFVQYGDQSADARFGTPAEEGIMNTAPIGISTIAFTF